MEQTFWENVQEQINYAEPVNAALPLEPDRFLLEHNCNSFVINIVASLISMNPVNEFTKDNMLQFQRLMDLKREHIAIRGENSFRKISVRDLNEKRYGENDLITMHWIIEGESELDTLMLHSCIYLPDWGQTNDNYVLQRDAITSTALYDDQASSGVGVIKLNPEEMNTYGFRP